jgi:hypothetical protein
MDGNGDEGLLHGRGARLGLGFVGGKGGIGFVFSRYYLSLY